MEMEALMAMQRTLYAIITGVALAGCGDLADESSEPPALGTITGSLSVAEGLEIPEGQLRMALLWTTESIESADTPPVDEACQSKRFLQLSQQDIALSTTFPSQFTLSITEPPPPEALHRYEENGPRISAEASIVVYADGNDNAALDVRPPDAASPDLVLATSDPEIWHTYETGDIFQHTVLYFTEPRHYESPSYTADFPQGFSLERYFHNQDAQILPIETPIDLRLTGDAYLQDLLCEQTCTEYSEPSCPASPADLPDRPEAALAFLSHAGTPAWAWSEGPSAYTTVYEHCNGSTTFSWRKTVCEECNCVEEFCAFEQADVPAEEWPCE